MVLVQNAPELQILDGSLIKFRDDLIFLVLDDELTHKIYELEVLDLRHLSVDPLFKEIELVVFVKGKVLEFDH